MREEYGNIINNWADENGDPEIDAFVQKQIDELYCEYSGLPSVKSYETNEPNRLVGEKEKQMIEKWQQNRTE
jgi:hypothetical protein